MSEIVEGTAAVSVHAEKPALASAAPNDGATPISEGIGVFYGQLAGLLKAGMPMPQALRTLAAEASSARFREAVQRAATAIECGASPEAAFAHEAATLGTMLARVSGAAAASGKLAALLSELSAWTLVQDRIRRQIVDALIYPYTVLLLSSLISLVMMAVASSSGFADLDLEANEAYGQMQSSLFSTNIPGTLAACAIGATFGLTLTVPLLGLLGRMSSAVRRWRENLLVRLPVLRAVARPMALSRFCGSVSILLKAGAPYHQAVVAGGELTGFAPYAEAARKAAEVLAAGGAQADAWASPLFPPSLRFILKSAEARGDVPEAFAELAELYRVEAEGRARVVALLAPPACLVAVGAVISLFIFGMLNPLIQIMERIAR